jgi:hypothetical protein
LISHDGNPTDRRVSDIHIIRISGFTDGRMNTIYSENGHFCINGTTTWWSKDKQFFMYSAGDRLRVRPSLDYGERDTPIRDAMNGGTPGLIQCTILMSRALEMHCCHCFANSWMPGPRETKDFLQNSRMAGSMDRIMANKLQLHAPIDTNNLMEKLDAGTKQHLAMRRGSLIRSK